jgi:hypothetical protein
MAITAKSFEELHRKAKKKIAEKTCYQIVLKVDCDISEIDSNFVTTYNNDAKKWQLKKKPEDLVINHGQYLFSNGDPFKFIKRELKKKPDSNRALFSMINMENIYKSNDDPIPSFLSLQFGLENNEKLLVSAYFRALEIYNFLPINIAEICLYIKKIKDTFSLIKRISCDIYTFKAYSNPNFYCLKKAELDLIKPIHLLMLLMGKKYDRIIEMIRSKATTVESVIDVTGIENLHECLQALNKKDKLNSYGEINKVFNETIKLFKAIQNKRKSFSGYKVIENEYIKIKKNLEYIEDYIRRMQ